MVWIQATDPDQVFASSGRCSPPTPTRTTTGAMKTWTPWQHRRSTSWRRGLRGWNFFPWSWRKVFVSFLYESWIFFCLLSGRFPALWAAGGDQFAGSLKYNSTNRNRMQTLCSLEGLDWFCEKAWSLHRLRSANHPAFRQAAEVKWCKSFLWCLPVSHNKSIPSSLCCINTCINGYI